MHRLTLVMYVAVSAAAGTLGMAFSKLAHRD